MVVFLYLWYIVYSICFFFFFFFFRRGGVHKGRTQRAQRKGRSIINHHKEGFDVIPNRHMYRQWTHSVITDKCPGCIPLLKPNKTETFSKQLMIMKVINLRHHKQKTPQNAHISVQNWRKLEWSWPELTFLMAWCQHHDSTINNVKMLWCLCLCQTVTGYFCPIWCSFFTFDTDLVSMCKYNYNDDSTVDFRFFFCPFFSRVHATLWPTLSVCRLSVCRSVGHT